MVESEDMTSMIAGEVLKMTEKLKIPFIFKASYKKANRTSLQSFSGLGDQEALTVLQRVKDSYRIPVLTDIHNPDEAVFAAKVADVLQIPAFLCRQTELLLAAGKTGRAVNIKKGQFLSAQSMQFAVDKVKSTGNKNIFLTERGTTFGYQDLVVDMRNIPAMKATGCPVILDVTHSLQQPNTSTGVTGGMPEMIETLAKAGIAAGADGIFIETHPDPAKALSDGANMLRLDKLENLLEKLLKIRQAIK